MRVEACGDGIDDDGDGATDEDCGVCTPGSTAPCDDGPAGTEGVGACSAGARTCDAAGAGAGACVGAMPPAAEVCGDGVDRDRDGASGDAATGDGPTSDDNVDSMRKRQLGFFLVLGSLAAGPAHAGLVLTFDGDDHGYDSCRAVAAGTSDEIIVTGQTQRFAQGANAWIRGWSSTGSVLWNHELHTASQGQDAGNDVAILSDGTAVVVGQWYSGSNTKLNHFLSRVSAAGVLVATTFGAIVNDDLYNGVARDANNTISVGGYRPDTGGSSAAWIRRFAPPPGMSELFSVVRNGPVAGADAVNKVATDAGGNIIVGGYNATATGRAGWIGKYTNWGGSLWIANIAATGTATDGVYDVGVGPGNVVVAVGRSGASSWIKSYSSVGALAWTVTDPGIIWRAVAVDAAGNIATAGNLGADLYVRVHDAAGTVLWDHTYANATGNGVAFDSLSNVLVCGAVPAGGSTDALVLTLP